MESILKIAPEVRAALADNRPIVALESTVITHGLPFPNNVETARAMETAIRDQGAVPATIAIIKGEIIVGINDDHLDYLGQCNPDNVRKCSRRDFATVVAQREDGATTVAGTMIIAHLAGIEMFATGGVGGVHRGHPFDVSADLTEMGRTPVTVVCSGAKSILDLPATREVLETNGVTVVGYGTDEMPAFFASGSGLFVDVRVDDAPSAAKLVAARRALSLDSATLVMVPVPADLAIPADEANRLAERAQADADAAGISGAASTPWLLNHMIELTAGRSLRANMALLQNNAAVAGAIAVALKNSEF